MIEHTQSEYDEGTDGACIFNILFFWYLASMS